MSNFKNIVSLGCFCSPAMEFERIERRNFSLPFDWLVTFDFEIVLKLIKENFNGFLNEEYLYQVEGIPSRYRNVKYKIEFYHDFSPVKSFYQQIDKVKEKYERRINRFYMIISEPTLFFRYIISRDEIQYIFEHYDEILNLLKSYNTENNIVFLVNDDIVDDFKGEIPFLWNVQKDEGDMFARRFLDKNLDLKRFILDNIPKSVTHHKKKNVLKKVSKIYTKLMLKMGFVYHYEKQWNSLSKA